MSLIDHIKAEIASVGGANHLALIIAKESPEWFNLYYIAKLKAKIVNVESSRRHRKKLPKPPKSKRNRRWNVDDEVFLRANFGRMKTNRLAKILGRTTPALALKFAAIATEEEKQWVAENGLYKYKRNNTRK